jgi:hypothetical protein
MRIILTILDYVFYKQIEILREDIRYILKSIKY